MSAKKLSDKLRTWIEIDAERAEKNLESFRGFLGPKVKIWGVVKSNAYGHGLVLYAKLLERTSIYGLAVDSAIEGLRLRREGIRKPILVLGPVLPALLSESLKANLTLTVSSAEALSAMAKLNEPPTYHLKIDTGMHRQGFAVADLPRVIKVLARDKGKLGKTLTGVFTHFAAAKDINYPTYTERQFALFAKAIRLLEQAGFKNLMRHCAASGGVLLSPKYHMDAVRVGMGLYGYYPSSELALQSAAPSSFRLKPVLSWRAVVSEIKTIESGEYVGYDLTERVTRRTKLAVIPVGYWHGFSRALSSVGYVLVKARPARVLGRVSMDFIVLDVTGIGLRVGDTVTLLGREGGSVVDARLLSEASHTTPYEFLTRLNPLMERVLI